MEKKTSAVTRKADFSDDVWKKVVPKNEDSERCWLSYADKARLGLEWEVGGSC